MRTSHSRWAATAVAAVALSTLTSTGVAIAETAPEVASYGGTSDSGAGWIAEVPSDWNGTLIVFSHGYSAMVPQSAPSPAIKAELLEEGYALVGSSYSGPSLWALATAVEDQFDAVAAIEAIIGDSDRTIAWGSSMGGLVATKQSEDPRGEIDGTISQCGIVAGGVNLLNTQLAGEFAAARLLSPEPIKLVDFANQAEADASVAALQSVTTAAQDTPEGRARIALAAALINTSTWAEGASAPGPRDYAAQQYQQYRLLVTTGWARYVGARPQVEIAAGGNASGIVGLDFEVLLASSTHADQVRALYREAGLDLRADLSTLTRDADIEADPAAVATLTRTSEPTGDLAVPQLNIHTLYDNLVPVEHQDWFQHEVARAGDASLLRQAYVDGLGHCRFEPAEQMAALHALEHRLDTGRWGNVTGPARLNAAGEALDVTGGSPRYVEFDPPRMVGASGEPGTRHP